MKKFLMVVFAALTGLNPAFAGKNRLYGMLCYTDGALKILKYIPIESNVPRPEAKKEKMVLWLDDSVKLKGGSIHSKGIDMTAALEISSIEGAYSALMNNQITSFDPRLLKETPKNTDSFCKIIPAAMIVPKNILEDEDPHSESRVFVSSEFYDALDTEMKNLLVQDLSIVEELSSTEARAQYEALKSYYQANLKTVY